MLLTAQTRNIIFDLGGVLIDLNYQLTFDAFAALGAPDIPAFFSRGEQAHLFDSYEKGLISSAEFRQELRKMLYITSGDEEIDNAWNAMLLTIAAERIQILKKLSSTHRVFLLSNTNEIHMTWINRYLEREHGIADFRKLFEKIWYSYEVGLRKPGKEIFEFALHDAGLQASESLFIDDSLPNVKGSLEAGLQAVHLQRAILPEDFGLEL